MDSNSTKLAAIDAKTTNLPSDPADQSIIVAAADAIIADTENIQSRLPAALVGGRMDSNVQAIADGVLTAAKFASGAFDAVWSVAARLLTAGTNIVLAKGTGLTGLNDLDAAGVRTAVGLASANLDTQLGAKATQASVDDLPTNAELATALAAADDAVLAAVAGVSVPTANQNADALLDRADAIEAGLTPRGALRVATAALAGKVSGADASAPVFRNVGDTKDRITATTDADGNRTVVTVDAS